MRYRAVRLDAAQQLVSEVATEYFSLQKTQSKLLVSRIYDAIKSHSMHVDLIVLTTPSGLHPSQAIAAAGRCNVCTEKPMATRWEDGVAMVKACDEANVRLLSLSRIVLTVLFSLLENS